MPGDRAGARFLPERAGLAGEPVPTCENQPALIAGDKDWYLQRSQGRCPTARRCRRIRPARAARTTAGPVPGTRRLPAAGLLDHQRLQPALPDLLHLQPAGPALLHAGRGDAADGGLDRRVSGRVDLINVTGGEPTLHPKFLELLDELPPAGDRPGHDELQRPAAGRGSGAVPAAGRAGRVRDPVVRHVRSGGESSASTAGTSSRSS